MRARDETMAGSGADLQGEDSPLLPRLSDYAMWHAARSPERTAIVFNGRRTSYAELAERIETCARALYARGIRRGDRIAMLSTPRPEFLIVYLAAGRIGAVFVGLNPRHTLREHQAIVENCAPRLLLGIGGFEETDFTATLHTLGEENPCIKDVVTIADPDRPVPVPVPDGRGIEQEYRAHVEAVRPEDPLCIVYTSGSTGRRKGALLTHGNFVAVYREAARKWAVREVRQIHNYPIDHIAGLGDVTAYAVISGGTLVFMERFDPAASLGMIAAERITVWGQEVAMFQRIVVTPEFATADLSSLDLIWFAGAAAPRDLVERLVAIGARVSTDWGMSESCGPVTFSAHDATLEELTYTVGVPGAACELAILGEQGTPCETGQAGEIAIRGPCLMAGYLDGGAIRSATDEAGWFRTGDLGTLLPDGNLALIGRSKEMIKSGGYNIYPREVEMVLEEHPGVRMATVVGVSDPIFQEVGHAFLMMDPPAELDDILRHCRSRLANYKIPKRFTFRAAFPMLGNGKVDRVALQQQAVRLAAAPQPSRGEV